ncbi:repetitive organellar protein-like isoform X3 [Vespa crabro]|nr:repetitive organellar protein-like isoform X2 [Vespa crabro]XP_046828030.1 repetitive organellar protein-like isoform X3 [Vespa crabro]
MSGTEDAYAPEEPTPDISMSLIDIQMPETPESTKGQASDGDTCRLESPRMLKPVLGKVQAKKRLMAFANKFNVLPKASNKSSVPQAQVIGTMKDNADNEDNTSDTKLKTKIEHSQHSYNRYSNSSKLKKKTEEKVLAIEEIRREESKSKLLLAEAMAAASLEEESFNRHNSTMWETSRNSKGRSRQKDTVSSHRVSNKSMMERKRKQHNKEGKEGSVNKQTKERHESKEKYYYKASLQNREQQRKDKEKKDDKCKRDETKVELNRDKKDDGKDKKEGHKDKKEEIREKKEESKDKKEKQNDLRESIADVKSKKDKNKLKDKEKEREIKKYGSWAEMKKSGVTLDEVIQLRKPEISERSIKSRTVQDYARYLDQMLMLNNYRLKRTALIAEGLDGPKEFPPESIKLTKRGRQLVYCENPRVSLLLNQQQLLQAVTLDRREKLRDICDATSIQVNIEDNEELLCSRNWYKKINIIKPNSDSKWQLSINVIPPKSKWDSEDEEISQENDEIENEEKQMEIENIIEQGDKVSTSISDSPENSRNVENTDNQNNSDVIKPEILDKASVSPILLSAGNEKLASEYEQFMKMVCTDIPLPDAVKTVQKFSSEKCLLKSVSPSNYHEFNIELTSLEDKYNTFSTTKSIACENQNKITNEVLTEKQLQENECLENSCLTFQHSEHSNLSINSQAPMQENERIFEDATICEEKEIEESESIPNDWENVRIKVEHLSDENSESRKRRRKKKRLQNKTSSSESSSSSSSTDSEDKKTKRRRNRKLSQDSSSSDSDSSESSSTSSSSESFSSDSKRRKKRRKKRKIGKRKRKAKRIARIKKRRRRKISSPSSSSESDERRKRKKINKRNLKSRKVLNEKEIDSRELINEVSDSTIKHTLQIQSASKKIKEEMNVEMVQGEKQNLWENKNKSVVNKESQDKTADKFLEEWEVNSVIIGKRFESQISEMNRDVSKLKDDEQNKLKKMDRVDKNIIAIEKLNEKRSDDNFSEGKQKIDNDLDEKKKRKKDKDKKSNTEFLTDWERESERIARQIIQDDMKLSKKLEKHKKEKWRETEFDTLNVPSLTQLEKEVSKGQLLADDWEVDSLEAIADLTVNKRRASHSSIKKLEKEVKYDKKTDTYIAVDKESARESRKKIERLCTIRIWEDEEEEGEKEAMMLVQEKNKRKKDDWDIEEESFMRINEKGKDNIDTSSITSATSAATTIVSDIIDIACNAQSDLPINYVKNIKDRNSMEMLDKLKENEFNINKKIKKSRWDIGSQSDEKMELKASVMWEEECVEWSNRTKSEHTSNRTSLDVSEKISLKDKVKDDICHVVNQPLNVEAFSSKYSENPTNFLKRKQSCNLKLEDKKLLEQSWSENANIDTIIEKTSIMNKKNPCTERLKTILDIDNKLGQRSIELYSPSSPAPSQKSEDIEASSSGINSTSLSKTRSHEDKNKELCQMEEKSLSSSTIPLQLKKFHENICIAPKISTSKHSLQNMTVHSKTEKCNTVVAENSEKLLNNLLLNDSCSDAHSSKSLQMDMFAEYETDISYSNENVPHVDTKTEINIKNDETNEEKATFKLIPKQFLIRRSNEHDKSKKTEVPLLDSAQQVAALLTIQKKLLQSHILDSDKEDTEFVSIHVADANKTLDANIISTDECSSTDHPITATNVQLGSKEEILQNAQLQSTHTKFQTSNMYSDQSDEYKNQDKKKGENTKTNKLTIIEDNSDTDIPQSTKSLDREERRKRPLKQEDDKRYNDRNKDKRDRKSNELMRDRIDKRDYKEIKRLEYNENRRKISPMRNKRKHVDSPCTSWECEGSGSGSHSRSWSRSRSKSPRRRDETNVYIRDRKLSRSTRTRNTDDRKDRFTRSPERSITTSYNKSNKNNRDEWNKRKYDSMEKNREKEMKPYDPIEILRERNMELNKHSENRVQIEEETDQTFWQFEMDNALRDGESLDSFSNQQDMNLDYNNRTYYRDESLEREIMEGPISSRRSKKQRLNIRRDMQWAKVGDSMRRTEKLQKRSRLSPCLRHSPSGLSVDRFRCVSRSRSRSWSRSRSRSRTRSRSGSRSKSRSRSRSCSRSRSKLQSRSRSRSRSTSRTRSRKRSPEYELRLSETLRLSRSPSLLRDKINGSMRERKEGRDSRQNCEETGRRIETIVQSTSSVTRVTADSTVMDTEMQISSGVDNVPSNFQYSGVNESSNDYYYTENNLTYPPCIDDTVASSPKRLSLDDRLELELGIKKQHEQETNILSDYSNNFNPNTVVYPSPPPQQPQQLYRRQPTVLQVGNVLQVVPADYNGISPARTEIPVITTPPIVHGSSQVVRVGNVLQVVPTSLDWSGGTQSTVDQPGTTSYSTDPSPSPVSVPISVPVPVPVPMPVPTIPSVVSTPTQSSTLSPVPLSLSIPVPAPVPIPISAATYPRSEITVQKVSAQPVYNYEAILEARRKEREERKRLREMRRKEKERRRIEKVNRRALRLLEKKTIGTPQSENTTLSDNRKIPPSIDRSVIKALHEGDEEATLDGQSVKEPDNSVSLITSVEEEEDVAGDDDEDDEEEEEAEGEDEDEDYEDPEDDEEEEELNDQKSISKTDNRKEEIKEIEVPLNDMNTNQAESKPKDWPLLPVAPLKGILISPGFRKDTFSNGNIDNLSTVDGENEDCIDKDEADIEKTSDINKGDNTSENKINMTKHKMKLKIKVSQKKKRTKKSVQFADGVKPGEGTSPSGGEGDMPSPPPPSSTISQDSPCDLKRSLSKRIKKEKRARHPKTKKKVKVKIIKLKKPRVTPLSAMMIEDSDELDDLPPPPPPPGSPPPPNLWPSYLSAYSGTVRATETQSIVSTPTPVQAPPPPTPLPLLVPPPPLNYTIQPCTKA